MSLRLQFSISIHNQPLFLIILKSQIRKIGFKAKSSRQLLGNGLKRFSGVKISRGQLCRSWLNGKQRGVIFKEEKSSEVGAKLYVHQQILQSAQFKKLKWVPRQRGSGYPSKRWGHTAIVHEGKLLIYGGNHSGVSKEGIYKIDCQTLEGGQIHFENMPQVRESHSCTLIRDSLFVFGGCINQETIQLTNDLLQFKLTEPHHYWRKIEQKNPIPPRESHVAVALSPRHLLVYGGSDSEENTLDDFWIVDLETGIWQELKDIQGVLEPKIGCTFNLVGNTIFVFGGQFGEGEDSQYSNELYRLRFQSQNYSATPPPRLDIIKTDVVGNRPAPRTGHCCVDFKGKMLLIVGGQGVTGKKAPILYNDLWAFDLRTSTWTQLAVQNRSGFRPRSNFTASIFKSTIYIFGGFINIINFKCTDDFLTITLHEQKHSHHSHNNVHHEQEKVVPKAPQTCSICKFEYLPQNRPLMNQPEQQVSSSENMLNCNLSNIQLGSKTISSSFQAIALVVHTIGNLSGENKKDIHLKYQEIHLEGEELKSQYLYISCNDVQVSKKQWENVIYSYRYLPEEAGFDLKNGLFRIGRQILVSYLFDDDMIHLFYFLGYNIYKFSFHKHSLAFELKQNRQNALLHEFLKHYKVDIRRLQQNRLTIFIGSLAQNEEGLEVRERDNGCDLQCMVRNQTIVFSEFIREYFLQQVPVNIILGQKKLPLIAYRKSLRYDRQIDPQSEYFKEVRLVLDEELAYTSSTYVKIYYGNRRVGVYCKYPFISGYMHLQERPELLNTARTRCDSLQVKEALQRQIQTALTESRKRQGIISIAKLKEETYRHP